jgi:integrase
VALSFVSEEVSMLFKDLVATWLSTVAAVTLKPSGYKSYEAICTNHLLPAYGDMPLEMITAVGVQAYVAERVESGLSPRTVANHVQVIRRLMTYAADNGLIESNPIASVATPRQEPAATRLRYLTPDQLRQAINAAPKAWSVLLATACMVGLRKGEQLSLLASDLSFENRTISVSKTIRSGVITSPKTPWSVGVVPMPESLVPLLQDRVSRLPDPDGLVFSRKDGSPLPDGLPNRILKKALDTAGLPQVSWHEFGRHSWVVAHLQAGTDIPTLQRLGRWKTADVLLSTYAHVQVASGGDAVRRLDELMSQQ